MIGRDGMVGTAHVGPGLPLALALVIGSALLACDDPGLEHGLAGNEVSVGRALPARDLTACSGSACGGSANDVPALLLDESPAVECTLIRAGSLEMTWEARLPGANGDPMMCEGIGRCTLESPKLVVASDDSLWVAAVAWRALELGDQDETGSGAWLGHYDNDGHLLSAQIVDFESVTVGEWVRYGVDLAPSGEARVLLAVLKQVAREGDVEPGLERWLVEYGPDSQPIGAAIALAGEYRGGARALWLAQAGGQAVALVNGERVAVVDDDRSLRWVQPRDGLATGLVSDAQGRPSLLVDSESTTLIEHYDSGGRLAWKRSFETAMWKQGLSVDGQGNLLRGGTLRSNLLTTLVHKISPEGDSIWVVEIPFPGQGGSVDTPSFAAAVDRREHLFLVGPEISDRRGPLFLVGPEISDPTLTGQLVYELAPDGRSCFAHEAAYRLDQLQIGPTGTLYAAWGGIIGRLQPR